MNKDEKKEKQAADAVDMLLLVECLPYAVYDLRKALIDENKLRQNTKYRLSQVEAITTRVTSHAWGIFHRISAELARHYVGRMDAIYAMIEENVYANGVEAAMNTITAIVNLISKYNHRLADIYYYEQAEPLYRIPNLLDCIVYARQPAIEFIIENIVKEQRKEYKIVA